MQHFLNVIIKMWGLDPQIEKEYKTEKLLYNHMLEFLEKQIPSLF